MTTIPRQNRPLLGHTEAQQSDATHTHIHREAHNTMLSVATNYRKQWPSNVRSMRNLGSTQSVPRTAERSRHHSATQAPNTSGKQSPEPMAIARTHPIPPPPNATMPPRSNATSCAHHNTKCSYATQVCITARGRIPHNVCMPSRRPARRQSATSKHEGEGERRRAMQTSIATRIAAPPASPGWADKPQTRGGMTRAARPSALLSMPTRCLGHVCEVHRKKRSRPNRGND